MSLIIDAAGLLAAAALKTSTITVRDSTLTIRELSLVGRQAFLEAHSVGSIQGATALLLHGVVCPKSNAPLLSQEQADELANASVDFVQEVTKEILKISGLSKDDQGNE